MKKLIFTLALLIIMPLVVNAEVCDKYIVNQYNDELKSIAYTLESVTHINQNGDEETGYIKLNFQNIPSPLEINIVDNEGIYSTKINNSFDLKGGVYELLVYVPECTLPIKNYEIKVPSYKMYCDLDKDCKNVWFDGTYEYLDIKEDDDNTTKINKKLVIVLISLILILLIIAIVIKYKRRRVVK